MEQAFVLILLPHRDRLNCLGVQLLVATAMEKLHSPENNNNGYYSKFYI